jgi:hypothetical protein
MVFRRSESNNTILNGDKKGKVAFFCGILHSLGLKSEAVQGGAKKRSPRTFPGAFP